MEVVNSVGQASTLWSAWQGRLWLAVEGIAVLSTWALSLGQRCSDLIVWDIWLPRVWKQWQDDGYALGRGGFAGGHGDQELHEVVVDLSAAGLDEEDIFASNRFAYLDTSLAHGELAEIYSGRWDAEMIADCVGKGGMGASSKDDDVAHHGCGGLVDMLSVARGLLRSC